MKTGDFSELLAVRLALQHLQSFHARASPRPLPAQIRFPATSFPRTSARPGGEERSCSYFSEAENAKVLIDRTRTISGRN